MRIEKTKIQTLIATGLLIGVMSGAGLAVGKIQRAQYPEIQLTAGEVGTVTYVIDGDTFILDSGLTVKLNGISAPQREWQEREQKPEPLANEAAEYLSELTKERQIKLFYDGDPRDRYGRATAQAWLLNTAGEKDVWIQEAIVKAGYGRVYPWTNAEFETGQLYLAEQEARALRRGIWNNRRTKSFYKIRKPEENALAQKVDSVQIVEGIVVTAADIKGVVYLNFGADFKTDFTVAINKKTRNAFLDVGIDPAKLTGARVRVRGWVELQNGPIIWLNTPNRLEIVE